MYERMARWTAAECWLVAGERMSSTGRDALVGWSALERRSVARDDRKPGGREGGNQGAAEGERQMDRPPSIVARQEQDMTTFQLYAGAAIMRHESEQCRRSDAAVDVLFAVVLGVLGALALVHWLAS
jgi:hypothetical protein